MIPASTDPSATRRDGRRSAAIGAAGVFAIVLAGLSGNNGNLLLLTLVLALFLIASAVIRNVSALAAAGVVAIFLVWVHPPVPELTLVDPGHIDRGDSTEAIPLQRRFRYTFTLRDTPARHPECGTAQRPATVFVDGMGLSDATVAVGIEGAAWRQPPEFLKSPNGLDQIQLKPDLDGVQEFSVLLAAKPDGAPAIRVGPEASGRVMFGHAVFLELKDDVCTILYQTRHEVDVVP